MKFEEDNMMRLTLTEQRVLEQLIRPHVCRCDRWTSNWSRYTVQLSPLAREIEAHQIERTVPGQLEPTFRTRRSHFTVSLESTPLMQCSQSRLPRAHLHSYLVVDGSRLLRRSNCYPISPFSASFPPWSQRKTITHRRKQCEESKSRQKAMSPNEAEWDS